MTGNVACNQQASFEAEAQRIWFSCFPDTVDSLAASYASGELSLAEFEARITPVLLAEMA
jgi:hypothetical protein